MTATPDPEFSRTIRLNEIGEGTRERQITADPAERAALARRFGLRALDRLEAKLRVLPHNDGWLVAGTLEADLAQACVATDEDVSAHVATPFAVLFVRNLELADGEDVVSADEDHDVVALEGERIDLGETVAQSLLLNLDPYPRVPDADAKLRALGVMSEEDAGPFAALKALRDKAGSSD